MIGVIDYGMGNTGSIQNMLRKLGASCVVTADGSELGRCEKLILPGVGAFDNAIESLGRLSLLGLLNEWVLERSVPILGICLGMQLLCRSSEEGCRPGLGWLNARTVRFSFPRKGYRLPHMGWNTVQACKDHPVLAVMPENPRYYFVHSYHVVCEDPRDVLLTSNYGMTFCSAVAKKNIVGMQFHPEKSHKFGLALLRNFLEW